MIELKNVERSYRAGHTETWVLRRVNLTIQPWEFVTVMGPSGAGKSSLLNVLAMLDDQWRGEFDFAGEAVHAMNRKQRADLSVRSEAGGPAQFLSWRNRCGHRCRATARPDDPAPGPHSTPQRCTRVNSGPFLAPDSWRSILGAPKSPTFRAEKPCIRCLGGPAEWSFWNPFGNDRRDQNSLAPNRSKARTTPLRPSRPSANS